MLHNLPSGWPLGSAVNAASSAVTGQPGALRSRRSLMVLSAVTAMLLCAFSLCARAQWEKLPITGGYATAMRQCPWDSSNIVALTSHAGMWRTLDGGLTWSPMNGANREFARRTVDELTWTKEGFVIKSGGDEYYSTDDGARWRILPLPNGWGVMYGNFQYTNSGVLYVPFVAEGGKDEHIIFSSDMGRHWDTLSIPLEAARYGNRIFVDPENPNIVILHRQYGRTYTTKDGGHHWNRWDTGADWPTDMQYYTFYRKSAQPMLSCWIYNAGKMVGGEEHPWYDMYATSDTGRIWSKVNTTPAYCLYSGGRLKTPIMYDSLLWVASFSNRVCWSHDGGASWQPISENNVYDFVRVGDRLVASSGMDGFQLSYDTGRTWIPTLTSEPLSTFEDIRLAACDDNTLFVYATQASGSPPEIRQTTDGGMTWKTVCRRYNLSEFVGAKNPDCRWYAIENRNALLSGTLDQATPDTLLTWTIGQETAISVSSFKIDISPVNPALIYCTLYTTDCPSQRALYFTTDAGRSWDHTCTPPFFYRYFFMTPSTRDEELVMGFGYPARYGVDTDGMGIWLSNDRGRKWWIV